MFVIGKFVGALATLPGLLFVLALCFLAARRRGFSRLSRAFLLALLGLAVLLSLTPLADLLLHPLESRYPAIDVKAVRVTYAGVTVVVLGGGFRAESPDYGGPALRPEAEARAVYGLLLARETGGRLLYSGGSPFPGRASATEADAARELYVRLGFPEERLILESRSLDTFDNATMSADLAKDGRILLVTSAWHMPRAMLAFEAAGFRPVAAPTAFRAGGGYTISDWLPSSWAYLSASNALHEYVGLAWYRIRVAIAPGRDVLP